MLQDIPSLKNARVNLLHVVPEQAKSEADDHRSTAEVMLQEAISRMGLNSDNVNLMVRDGDAKQTVLKGAEELDNDLLVMGSRGLGRAFITGWPVVSTNAPKSPGPLPPP